VARLKSTSPRAGGVGDVLDEFNDGPPNVAVLDPPECLHKTQRIRRIEKIDDVATAFPIAGPAESTAEKEQDRHVEDLGNLLQPSDLDAVVSGLIFLHLLERHAERKPQRLLGQPELEPPQLEALTDVFVPKRWLIGRRGEALLGKPEDLSGQLSLRLFFWPAERGINLSG